MNIVRKVAVVSCLAATVALSAVAALPAYAQMYHHHPLLRRASRLDRMSARASVRHHYRRASRLARRAARLDRRASHHI